MTSSAKMASDSLGLELRKKIIGDYVSGMSQKSISDKYRVKKWTVSRLCSKYRSTGKLAADNKGGRPRSTTSREDTMIVRSVKKDPWLSSVEIQKQLELPVSDRTIRQRAVEDGLFSRRPARKPLISLKNQKKRLLFATSHNTGMCRNGELSCSVMNRSSTSLGVMAFAVYVYRPENASIYVSAIRT